MTTQTEVRRAPFDLVVGHDAAGQTGSMIRVRWCLTPETVQELVDQEALNPVMLIVVTDDSSQRELARHVFPLIQELAFISLNHAGVSTLHATIVWPKSSGDSVERVLKADNDVGGYRVGLMEFYCPGRMELIGRRRSLYDELCGDEYRSGDRRSTQEIEADIYKIDAMISGAAHVYAIREDFGFLRRLDYEVSINIDVPPAMFAPEPPKITKWLSELYQWKRPPRDQCERRKRAYVITLPTLPLAAVMAVTVAVAVAIWWVICKLSMLAVVAVLNIWGSRGIDYYPLWDIKSFSVKDIWFDLKPSIWWTRKEQVSQYSTIYPERHLVFKLVNPPAILGLSLLSLLATRGEGSLPWWAALAMFLVAWLALAFVVQSRRSPKAVESQMKTELSVLAQKLDGLTCTLDAKKEATLAALPKERRTVYLRFLDVKSKVCRPYAKK